MIRVTKSISAYIALAFVSVARPLTGFVALLQRRPVEPERPKEAPKPPAPLSTYAPKPSSKPTTKPNHSTVRYPELDLRIAAIVKQAKHETGSILPGWTTDVCAFCSMEKLCYDFHLRAIRPESVCFDVDNRPESVYFDVDNRPPDRRIDSRVISRQEWSAEFSVSIRMMLAAKPSAALDSSLVEKLFDFARDIRSKAPK